MLSDPSRTNSQSLTGAIYFMVVVQQFLNFIPTILVFKTEEAVYLRERSSGLYQIWVYATSKLLAEMPLMLFFPMLVNVLLYWVIGFEDKFAVFFKFYLGLVLVV